MPRLLLTRPDTQNKEWQPLLQAAGFETIAAPLLAIHPLFPPTSAKKYDGLIITSRHAVTQDSSLKNLALYLVGEQVAAQAQECGFADIRHIAPTAEALAEYLRRQSFAKPLLYLSGNVTRVDLAALLAPDIVVHKQVVYDAIAATELPPEAITAIRKQELEGVLFFSPRSAEIFLTLVRKAALPLEKLEAFCLSEDIAAKCEGAGWKGIFSAARPDRDTMLDLITTHYRN